MAVTLSPQQKLMQAVINRNRCAAPLKVHVGLHGPRFVPPAIELALVLQLHMYMHVWLRRLNHLASRGLHLFS